MTSVFVCLFTFLVAFFMFHSFVSFRLLSLSAGEWGVRFTHLNSDSFPAVIYFLIMIVTFSTMICFLFRVRR